MQHSTPFVELLRQAERKLGGHRLSEAEALCLKAVALEPNNAQAKVTLGIILSACGDTSRAIPVFKDAVALAPAIPEATLHLVTQLRRVGRLQEAVAACRQFISIVSNLAIIHSYLGMCLFDLGDFGAAADAFKEATALEPDDVTFRRNLAFALEQAGRKGEAARVLREVLAISSDRELQLNIARLLIAEGKTDAGLSVYGYAAAELPDSFEAHFEFGKHLLHAGRADHAITALARAASIQSDNARVYLTLGKALQRLGRFEEAITHFEQVLSLEPGSATAFLEIANSKKITAADSPILHRMDELLNSGAMPPLAIRSLHYALGKANDDLGFYEAALKHYDEATVITLANPAPGSKPFSAKAEDAKVSDVERAFTSEFFARHSTLSLGSELPLFIVGAPRSGTTLLEQMLSQHPEIGAAGEQPFWHKVAKDALRFITENDPRARDITEGYLDLLRTFGPDEKRVVDKYPMNYLTLGLIHKLLPNARIIHCRRHPVDTCLSLYMNAHDMSHVPFGYRREDIVCGYRCYLRTMEHWRNTLPPERFLETDYEELVRNPEEILRGILDFSGLEWNSACVHPEMGTRVVATPSRWQVRQPIYSTSVGRWRQYEPWLGAFRELMVPEAASRKLTL